MYYKVALSFLIVACIVYILVPSPSDEKLSSHFKEKVVLICGASSGIGEELAYQLARYDTKLVLVARNQEKLDHVKEGVMKLGNMNVKTISFDFSDVKDSSRVINQTVAWYGKLDYLVSNHAAMISGAFLAFPHQQNPEYLEQIFRINLFSQIELAIHAIPLLEASNGHMFFTSSIAGEVPFYVNSIYCSTKHAMNGFFYSLQQELIAKESKVSLTIGAFGLILTNDLKAVFESANTLKRIPSYAVGDVKECAHGMVESYVKRPQTMTYPQVANYLMRFLWYFYPSFHELMIKLNKPEEAKGSGYDEMINVMTAGKEIKKKLKFQQGYDGN